MPHKIKNHAFLYIGLSIIKLKLLVVISFLFLNLASAVNLYFPGFKLAKFIKLLELQGEKLLFSLYLYSMFLALLIETLCNKKEILF